MAEMVAVLLKAQGATPQAGLIEAQLRNLAARAAAGGMTIGRIAAYGWRSGTHAGPEVYAYLWLAAPRSVPADLLPGFDGSLAGLPAQAGALERVDDRAGASSGADAPVHYVVETDLAPGSEGAVNDWYDGEHLAGLAAVPGTVRAQRLVNLTAGPRSYACYDLVSLDTHDSPPWLEVRGTEWAARVRPNFRNTKRTLFERLFDLAL